MPSEPHRIVNYLADSSVYVNRVRMLAQDTAEIQYVDTSDALRTNMRGAISNLAIAAFVTAGGRLTLYKQLRLLGDQVFYCDTDSIMYTHKPGQYDIYTPPVKTIGTWTDELESNKSRVVEVIIPGPKNYAFKFEDGSWAAKVKGIRMNRGSKAVLTYDAMREVLLQGIAQEGSEGIKVPQTFSFLITPDNELVQKVDSERTYRFVFTKRVIPQTAVVDGTIVSYPYGWNQ
jgi:hypothetical protein